MPNFSSSPILLRLTWCQILNVRLSVSAHEDFASSLDYAFLASLRHSWRVLFDRMPDEALTFVLGESVQGVRISIRVSGLFGLIQMWRRFSRHCYEDNEKADLCVALWERRHWLQMSTMRNAIQAFEAAADPLDPFMNTILDLWYDLNRMRNNRADLLRQQIDRLWDWCTGAKRTLPTEVLLEPSHLHYSTEVLELASTTEDWFKELRVLDAEQQWRTCGIGVAAEHPYNISYAPCNPKAPVFVPSSMTRQAVISNIVVDSSFADAGLSAPWIEGLFVGAKESAATPVEPAGQASVGTDTVNPEPTETTAAGPVLLCPCRSSVIRIQ
ncbi:hypothetical protein PHMEG_00032382 [Phytophthora megakarya]|uniref:Uncharacterized protein n=1 Tax=Phytophthora megakarya TaxID=4795 RepID=A0A225UVN9_9STRA|nr:hypothetical protein PHMEG_00032382 [Phytophthora megakarya]